jgi:hypothetical protein
MIEIGPVPRPVQRRSRLEVMETLEIGEIVRSPDYSSRASISVSIGRDFSSSRIAVTSTAD